MNNKYPLLITLATLAIIGGLLASTKNKTLTHLTPSLTTSKAGFNDIVIQARGTNNKEKIALYINNTPVTFWNLSNNFQDYTYTPNGEITVSELSIHFLNDTWEPENNINYDVQIPYITVNGTKYNSEHPSTVSTGSWDQDNWCAPGNKQTQWLHCNGSFTYNIPVGTVVGLPTTNPICGNNQIEEGEQCDDGNVASGDGCSVSCTTESSVPLSGLIFETNFDNDSGYTANGLGLWNGGGSVNYPPPWGWDGIKGSNFSVIENAGENNTNALKIDWAADVTQPTRSLGKHLTGDVARGFDELYIRYNVKLPNAFKAGNGNYTPYWKWGRLWQNTWPTYGFDMPDEYKWTENRPNSKYVVWNFGGSTPYRMVNATWGANSGSNLESGSSGGQRYKVNYFVSGTNPPDGKGYFEHFGGGAWELDGGFLKNNTSQKYHTVEYRFKLATTETSNDGIFEMWWDGEFQGDPVQYINQGGAPEKNGIPTTRDISGFNFLTFFDNMAGWNVDWDESGVEGGIYVSDVVISTNRIGHDYVAGNTDNVSN